MIRGSWNMSHLQMLYGQVIANVFAVLIFVLCWRSKTFGRLGLVLLFLWASQYNLRTAFVRPEVYTAWARFAYSTWYQQFILGFFGRHTIAIVAAIAIGQLSLAVLMALRGRVVYWGLTGAIADLVAIAPLGSTATFPATLIAACGAVLLLRESYPLSLPEQLTEVFGYHWPAEQTSK
jgi:hypothetical protein